MSLRFLAANSLITSSLLSPPSQPHEFSRTFECVHLVALACEVEFQVDHPALPLSSSFTLLVALVNPLYVQVA